MSSFRPVPESRGFLTFDPEAQGKSAGHLMFPWSRDDSAWGMLPTPVGLVANGKGPTVLLVGGNHGDEMEGPLALRRVFADLEPKDVAGRIFFLPTLNHAAACAGRRTSPIDGGNMNRSFTGRPDGTMTEQIAHFVEAFFVERADAVLDIHSGGRTMDFAPFAATHRLGSPALQVRANEAVAAFGTPYGLVLEELDARGMLDTAVERHEKLFVTTELGGGGGTTARMVDLATRGVRNLLAHIRCLPGHTPEIPQPPRMLSNAPESYLAAPHGGMIDYALDLEAEVQTGDLIATLIDPDDLVGARTPITAPCDGLLLGRFHGGIVRRGDFLGLVAVDQPVS